MADRSPVDTAKAEFTALKFNWIEQMTSDPDLGHLAARVGVIIASHLNQETGEAFPGQKSIATRCGVSIRQVQRALNELAGRLHVAIQVQHGPKQSSRYRPLIWSEKATPASPIGMEKATFTVANTRHTCRPNPLKEPTEVKRAANDQGESPPSGPLPDGFPGADLIDLSHERFLRESLQVDAALCAEKFRAYFSGATCANWRARWETWVLREVEHTRKNAPPAAELSKAQITLEQRAQLRAVRARKFADTGVWEADWGVPPDLRASAVAESSEAVVVSYIDQCDWQASTRTLEAPLGLIGERITQNLEGWLGRNGLKVAVRAAQRVATAPKFKTVGWV